MTSDERLRHPDQWVGQMLHGKWRIDELLGIGGVATVYAATDRSGQRVALKLLHAHWADDETVRARFLREGYAANRVKHPAVISASADGVTQSGIPFLVLEYLEGRSLEAELIINGRLGVSKVLDIADQVLDALDAAHAIGVLHRDLKPDNLLLSSDGTVRLLDFGIARLDDPEQTQDPRLTVNGRAMGTPGFMPPEQVLGDWDRVDARTDVWSLGATLFALITGREVHEGSQRDQLLMAMTQPAPALRDVAPEVPAAVAIVIDRALVFRPEGRWQSAAEMRAAVQKAQRLLAAGDETRADREGVDREGIEEAPPTLRPVATDPMPRAASASGRARGRRLQGLLVAAATAAASLVVVTAVSDHLAARAATHHAALSAELSSGAVASAALVEAAAVKARRAAEAAAEKAAAEKAAAEEATLAFDMPEGEIIDLDQPDPE